MDDHPLNRPCRVVEADGVVVIKYLGWACISPFPYEVIEDPTPEEHEAARQDHMECRLDVLRHEFARYLRRHADDSADVIGPVSPR